MLAYDPALRLILSRAPQHQHTARDSAMGAEARAIEARLAHCRDLPRLIAKDEGDEHHVR